MPLDPTAKLILDVMEHTWPRVEHYPGAEARRLAREATQLAAATVTPEPVARVEDRRIPGPAGDIPVRIYWPRRRPGGAAPPLLVYFHGGGWVICDLDTHDGTCRALVNEVGCVVVSVDYRLAPEHRFPAAVDDAYAATVWTAAHGAELDADPTRLAVAGDSAGGNVAAVVSLMARDRGGPQLAFQLLVYPVTDHDFETASYRENGEDYIILTRSAMEWYWDQYVPEVARRSDPYAAPLHARDLSGLPPALVITAECDPLRDEGEEYGRRLREAAVPTEVRRYDGMMHGFFNMHAVLDGAKQAHEAAAGALRSALGVVEVA